MKTIEELQKEGFEVMAIHVLFQNIPEILEGQETDEIRIYRETVFGKPNPTRYYILRRDHAFVKANPKLFSQEGL